MLCLLWLIGTAAHAYSFKVGDFCYNILSETDKTVAVTYPNDKIPTTTNPSEYNTAVIEIPAEVNNDGITYTVTEIGQYAFYCCSDITSVTISNNVTSIGSNAFKDCEELISIDIPNSVTSVFKELVYSN